MGYNTTVLILNDGFGEIERHPEEFVAGIGEKMNRGGDIGAGNHGNVAYVMRTDHADVSRLYFTGGNWISEFGYQDIDPAHIEHYRQRVREAKRMLRDFEQRLNECQRRLEQPA
jgi:hypothetical protein